MGEAHKAKGKSVEKWRDEMVGRGGRDEEGKGGVRPG